MNNSQERQTTVIIVIMILGSLILASIIVCLLASRSSDRTSFEHLRHRNAELFNRVPELERTIFELESVVRRLQALIDAAAPHNEHNPAVVSADPEVGRQLFELIWMQREILTRFQKVAVRATENAVGSTSQNHRTGVAQLKALKEDLERNATKLKERLYDLAVTLKVPDELWLVYPEQGVSTPKLKSYWSFFEARREYATTKLILTKVQMRVMAEEIDDRIEDKLSRP
jgi:hypothetical protein